MDIKDNEIPQSLIEECIEMSAKNGEIMCIFDRYTMDVIEGKKGNETDVKFYIKPWYHVLSMPSRSIYYDTETKLVNRFRKIDKVMSFLESIDFVKYDCNDIQIERDNVFFNEKINTYLTLKPNLMIYINNQFIFYDPTKLLSIVIDIGGLEYKRDLQIKHLFLCQKVEENNRIDEKENNKKEKNKNMELIKEVKKLEGILSMDILKKLDIFIINSNLDKKQRAELVDILLEIKD